MNVRHLVIVFLLIFTSQSGNATSSLNSCRRILRAYPQIEPIYHFLTNTTDTSMFIDWSALPQLSEEIPSRAKALELLGNLRTADMPIRKEIADQLASRFMTLRSPDLWNLYLGALYDKVVPFVPAYLNIGIRSDHYLPTKGLIADLGSGTGMIASVVSARQRGRFLVLYEKSEAANELAKLKMEGLAASYRILPGDVMNLEVVDIWDGAILNNVLYAIADKRRFLTKVYNALQPGGVFVLNDPNRESVGATESFRFQKKVMLSALQNGAPLTERDIALIVSMNLSVLMNPENLFAPPAMIQLLESVGFNVSQSFDTYFGLCQMYIATKPREVKKPFFDEFMIDPGAEANVGFRTPAPLVRHH